MFRSRYLNFKYCTVEQKKKKQINFSTNSPTNLFKKITCLDVQLKKKLYLRFIVYIHCSLPSYIHYVKKKYETHLKLSWVLLE